MNNYQNDNWLGHRGCTTHSAVSIQMSAIDKKRGLMKWLCGRFFSTRLPDGAPTYATSGPLLPQEGIVISTGAAKLSSLYKKNAEAKKEKGK